MATRITVLLISAVGLLCAACIGGQMDLTGRKLLLYDSQSISVAAWEDGAAIGPLSIASGLWEIRDVALADGSIVFLAGQGPDGPGAYLIEDGTLVPGPHFPRLLYNGSFITFSPRPGFRLAVASVPTGPSDTVDLLILDWDNPAGRVRVAEGARYPEHVSWHPREELIAYESASGDVVIHALKSDEITRIGLGEAPAWSNSGELLVFYQGRQLVIFDRRTARVRSLARHPFWRGDFLGKIRWSPDDRFLAVNAYAGMYGYELRYQIVEVATGRIVVGPKSYYWCGPWVRESE